jgi:hypothetical protein
VFSIVLSAAGSQGTLPPIGIPGGGGNSQITLPGGTVGTAYAQNLTVGGGSGLYTWLLVGGALPAGLTLSSSGSLSGTPTQSGGSLFTASVTDGVSSASSSFALTIAPQPIAITTASLPNGIVGTQYPTQVLEAAGGTAPYTFQISGALPSGLTFSNGAISGTPAAAGTYPFTVNVSDSGSPAQTGSAQISITISPAGTALVLSQTAVTFTLASGASILPPIVRVNAQSSNASQAISYSVEIPAKLNAHSERKPNGIPG